MVEREVIIKDTKLKYTGLFDLGSVYNKVLEWFDNEKLGDAASVEKSYLERIGASGKQIEIIMMGKKKDGGYFRFEITVKIFAKKMQDAETVVDGNKIKINKGECDLQFSSALVWNVNDEGREVFPEGSFSQRFYERFLIRDKIEDMKIDAYKDTMKFIAEMKNFMNLYKF